jgi:ribonuclease-3
MRTLEEFQRTIGWDFKNSALLREALTHRSYSFEKKSDYPDNQRLEFFGDAVLEIIASEYLFNRYPDATEGELTKIRSSMTRGDALYELAVKLEIDNYMFLGKGEKSLEGKNQETRVIDAFEALIAALYIDAGYDFCRDFYLQLVSETWDDPYDIMLRQNPKGTLQEMTQKLYGERPVYKLKRVSGQEHEPTYEIQVHLKGEVISEGSAGSRKRAEEDAARGACDFLKSRKNRVEKS